MSFSVEVDIAKFAAQMAAGGANLPGAVERGLDRAAQVVLQMDARQLQSSVYAGGKNPIPTREQVNAYNRTGKKIGRKRIGGAGKKAWQRTGELAASEAVVNVGAGERAIDSVGPAARYAERRHQLGLTWTPKKPALGIVRRFPWREKTLEVVGPQTAKAFEQGFREGMGGLVDK